MVDWKPVRCITIIFSQFDETVRFNGSLSGFLFFYIEGVQLLCMIDKGLDACRYLQTYGKWDQAAWLAKVR